jgi:hypothetical protein
VGAHRAAARHVLVVDVAGLPSSSTPLDLVDRAPAWTTRAKVRFMRSMAQNRFTAVGRVAAISSQNRWNSVANCFVPLALLRFIPSASPIAAATPIAGAPRMTIVLIAFATSLAVLQVTYTSDAGSLRWSIITTASSFHSIVREHSSRAYSTRAGRKTCPYRSRASNGSAAAR